MFGVTRAKSTATASEPQAHRGGQRVGPERRHRDQEQAEGREEERGPAAAEPDRRRRRVEAEQQPAHHVDAVLRHEPSAAGTP